MSKLLEYAFRPRNYMGASFQAPRATPRQRLMEMHHGEHLKAGTVFRPFQNRPACLWICWTVLESAFGVSYNI